MYVFSEYEIYYKNALFFISDGLENGEYILLIEKEEFYSTIKTDLLLSGYSEERVALIKFVNRTDFYLKDNKFSAENSSIQLNQFLEEYSAADVRVRIWGRVNTKAASIINLIIYENECDKVINDSNVLTVCSYNGLETPAYFQNELLKVHEYLMVDDQIEKSPLYSRKNINFSDSDLERLRSLEEENNQLKVANEKLLVESARQRESEMFLKIEKENAEKANYEKNMFLSHMSHDLRTPLNTIQGYSQILLMKEEYANNKKEINKIYGASEQLLKLIEEILDFTVIDSGKINVNKEVIELNSFLENCISSILDLNTTDVTVQLHHVENDVFIQADPVRLNQIVTNLLNNAIKYNNPNGEISIYCCANQNDEIVIHFKDSGIGIEKEETHLIFEPFYRSKSTMNSWEGTGLGLAIVAQLTKRMGGHYGVVSEKGVGSTFWVSFKKADSNRDMINEKLQEIQEQTLGEKVQITVLYVEDNSENIAVMSSMLDLMDHVELIGVATGKEGIEKACSIRPDIVLLDLSLPDIDGFQVLGELRSNPITKHIPIVAVSADAMESTVKKALREGCKAYITKPIHYEELRNIIESY
nr:ATP-binding protein [Bacillus alkalicola]